MIILSIIFPSIVLSQPCLPEGITFTTQAQIDSFQIIYPGCTEIEGDVRIEGDDITNLNGLNVLVSVEGRLVVASCDSLTSLTGLDGLLSIGGSLKIGEWGGGNPRLISLTGLEGLTSIGGSLRIEWNNALTNLTGLDNVTYIGYKLAISMNNTFTSLTGLEGLTSIGNSVEIRYNNALINLTGLDNVAYIGNELDIQANNALASLTGLEGLTSIGGSLTIFENDVLTSLAGLKNIESGTITELKIGQNFSLSDCDVQSICDYLSSPNGEVGIRNNAIGCNNPPEIANNCGIIQPCLPFGDYYLTCQADIDNFQSMYPGCVDLQGDIYIKGEDITNLQGLNVLTSVAGSVIIYQTGLTNVAGLENLTSIGNYLSIHHNDAMVSLTGLDNVEANTISGLIINENPYLSTCHVLSICDYLAAPNGEVDIHDNATGCNGPEEVQDSCEAHGSIYEKSYTLADCSVSPNPFTTSTTLSFRLEKPENVQFTVYNVQSQIVFMMQERQEKGEQQVQWNAEGLPTGMYYFRIQAGNMVGGGKLIKY
jgi:hypothetical protein